MTGINIQEQYHPPRRFLFKEYMCPGRGTVMLQKRIMFFTIAILLSNIPDISAQTSIESLKGQIYVDPANRQKIEGFVHIAFAWAEQLEPPENLQRGLINLKEGMTRWTDVETRIDKHLYLSSNTLLKMPFVFVTTERAFELTRQERENVRNYLLNGGFMVLDNATPRYERSQAEASLRKMMRDSLGSRARFEPIPNDHPLYRMFFTFDDGPPIGAEIGMVDVSPTEVSGKEPRGAIMSKPIPYLEGIWIGNRLVAVLSNKGYVIKWSENSGNEPQLKIGVNMVVFALRQKGGLARVLQAETLREELR